SRQTYSPTPSTGTPSCVQQLDESVLGDPCLANQRAKCSLCEFTRIRHCQSPLRRMSKDDVTAGLMIHRISHALECGDGRSAGTDRQPAPVSTSTNSSVIGGGGASPCFSRLARYPWIASLMLASAS